MLVFVKVFKFYHCYDLIPISAKLIVFDTQLLVKKAFHALVSNGEFPVGATSVAVRARRGRSFAIMDRNGEYVELYELGTLSVVLTFAARAPCSLPRTRAASLKRTSLDRRLGCWARGVRYVL